ncbi:MAG: phytoene/squalene synthase family protein, partial [Gammaproteobacteria bacterium]
MPEGSVSIKAALARQDDLLPGVSRTFALTIPQLPEPLATVVTNAYLLCRIADTIEDDVGLTAADKTRFHNQFVAVVAGQGSAQDFAARLAPLLSRQTLAAERDLVADTAAVVQLTEEFPAGERAALERCVRIMCQGMPEFQRNNTAHGLGNIQDLSRYCYFVAGVVGEMLTDLFCLHASDIARSRDALAPLAVSFGQGLQMTNILKDVWEDQQAGTCWLPRSVFGGADLAGLRSMSDSPEFHAGMEELIGIAHRHLRYAMDYSCAIPRAHRGIRRFCFWAVGMAILTLRRIHGSLPFTSGAEVKISRRAVKTTVGLTNLFLDSNWMLNRLFGFAAQGVPLASRQETKPEAAPEAHPFIGDAV